MSSMFYLIGVVGLVGWLLMHLARGMYRTLNKPCFISLMVFAWLVVVVVVSIGMQLGRVGNNFLLQAYCNWQGLKGGLQTAFEDLKKWPYSTLCIKEDKVPCYVSRTELNKQI